MTRNQRRKYYMYKDKGIFPKPNHIELNFYIQTNEQCLKVLNRKRFSICSNFYESQKIICYLTIKVLEFMVKNDISIEELSRKINIPKPSLEYIFRDGKGTPIERLVKLSKFIEIPLENVIKCAVNNKDGIE